MINTVKHGLLFLALCSAINQAFSDAESETGTSTSTSSPPMRMNRKYYDADIYSGAEFSGYPLGEQIPRGLVAKKNVIPYRHAGSGILKKNGNNLNWNVWKGDDDNSGDNDDNSNNDEIPKWQHQPQQGWDNNAWVADPMTIMLLKNAMAEVKGENKPVGFLSKLTSDPALLLIAASIPISLLLAAVLPTVINIAMGSNNIPTVSTTATGTKARSSSDIMPYLTPVMEALGTFGVRSISNPDCMQKIFCQVAQEKIGVKDFRYFKKAATVARFLSDGNWLENFAMGDLVDSLANGNCENVRCSHSRKKEKSGKSRYSQKVHLNSVKK